MCRISVQGMVPPTVDGSSHLSVIKIFPHMCAQRPTSEAVILDFITLTVEIWPSHT